jgi:hypothetical protein
VFIWTHFQVILLQISHTEHNQQQQEAFSRFMYGIKADETRRKYVSKLEQFFDFYKIEGETIPEKYDKLITSLRTAYATELDLYKKQTSYDDLLDGLRLALKAFEFK